jgi:hypothetical protein
MVLRKIPLIFACLLGWIWIGDAQAAPNVTDILKQIDHNTELAMDITAKVQITQQKAGEGVKSSACIYYRRDEDDVFLIVMTDPEVVKGNGYLKQNDNMWMYRRNTRTFQHISRDENIGGTDAKSEDFEKKKLMALYQPAVDKSGAEILKETKVGEIPAYQFEIKAKVEDVAYPKKVYWVRKDNLLPLKVQGYSLNGTLMETNLFLKYTRIQGKYLWLKCMFVDEFQKGNKTVVAIQNIATSKIAGYIFTKAYLENLSK